MQDLSLPPDVLATEAAKMQPAAIVCPDDPKRLPRWIALMAGNLWDAGTTHYAVSRGVPEQNFLFRGIVKEPALLYGVKAGSAIVTSLLLDRVARTHCRPDIANGMAAMTAAAHSTIGTLNLVAGKTRRQDRSN